MEAPARRRLGCVACGLCSGRAAAVITGNQVEALARWTPLCTPEEASLSAEGLTLLRDAEVQRFLVDGILLVQPSSLSSAFHTNLIQRLEDGNEHGDNREHSCCVCDADIHCLLLTATPRVCSGGQGTGSDAGLHGPSDPRRGALALRSRLRPASAPARPRIHRQS